MKTEFIDLDRLQGEKIALEIRELKRRWYMKPNYLIACTTLLATFITLIWTLSSGIFSKKYENLQLEKNRLDFEIRMFLQKRDSVQILYEGTLDSLKILKNALQNREQEIIYNYKVQEQLIVENLRSQNKLEEIIRFYKDKLDSLTYIAAQKEATKEVQSQNDGIRYLSSEDGKILLTEDGKGIRVRIKDQDK